MNPKDIDKPKGRNKNKDKNKTKKDKNDRPYNTKHIRKVEALVEKRKKSASKSSNNKVNN